MSVVKQIENLSFRLKNKGYRNLQISCKRIAIKNDFFDQALSLFYEP